MSIELRGIRCVARPFLAADAASVASVANAIRPFVVGRKGWLFSDTVKGAVASANLCSLVETAKANDVEPHAYLSMLFERLPSARDIEDFETLLPWDAKERIALTKPLKWRGPTAPN